MPAGMTLSGVYDLGDPWYAQWCNGPGRIFSSKAGLALPSGGPVLLVVTEGPFCFRLINRPHHSSLPPPLVETKEVLWQTGQHD